MCALVSIKVKMNHSRGQLRSRKTSTLCSFVRPSLIICFATPLSFLVLDERQLLHRLGYSRRTRASRTYARRYQCRCLSACQCSSRVTFTCASVAIGSVQISLVRKTCSCRSRLPLSSARAMSSGLARALRHIARARAHTPIEALSRRAHARANDGSVPIVRLIEKLMKQRLSSNHLLRLAESTR